MDNGIVYAIADAVFVISYFSFFSFLLHLEAKLKEKNT